MKKLVAAFLCTALAVSFGCNETKSTPGGPGATGTQGKGTRDNTPRDTTPRDTAAKDNSFTIAAPSSESIKQGQSKEIGIRVNRGKDFKQNIKLTVTSEDKGVMLKPEHAELKASDNAGELKFNLEVGKDAAIGEHRITVKATPETGQPTDTTFTVKVTGP